MDIIRIAIERPVAVIAAVLMAVMFGIVALQTIPIQLAPDVRRPIITVETKWFGAAPAEIEREILNEQEEALQGLENLKEMVGQARDGESEITLEFAVGTDMSRALLLTANRLDRVTNLPAEADEPTLETAGSEDNAIAWFRLAPVEGNTTPIHQYGDFAKDVVAERMERVAGISRMNVYGGGEREMQIIVQPERMAQYGLTVSDVVDRLRAANASITGGDVEEGKRRYVVRTDAEFKTTEQVENVVLRSQRDEATGRVGRVTLGDIADVRFGYKEATAAIRTNGDNSIAMSATRETGANVIETMKGVRAAVEELNSYELPKAGLSMRQMYDETVYINSAIDLVTQNIWVGGVMAALILMIFLRSVRATAVIALAIPVSVIASFVAMAALGRSLNVVSLAGIAFAVGMVVDAAIVVLENIYRHRQEGLSAREAAYKGAKQVWGAILVSALTTVMVFIPILVMEQEVGQLFRDIAVAISISVILSLLVSITVIPALSNRFLASQMDGGRKVGDIFPFSIVAWFFRHTLGPVLDAFGRAFAAAVVGLTRAVVASRLLAFAIVCSVTAAACGSAYYLAPPREYLPDGNQNFVFGVLFPPPGYNLVTMRDIALEVEGKMKPNWADISGPDSAPGEPPKMRTFFFVATEARAFMGASSVDPLRASELKPTLQGALFGEPGLFGFFQQTSLFGRGLGGSRSVNMDISGPELESIVATAQRAFGQVAQVFPFEEGSQIRPLPSLELGSPEIRVIPNEVALSDNGLTARELGLTVDTFNDGSRVDEITIGGDLIDLTLKGPATNVVTTQGIDELPVVTRSGTILPVSSLSEIQLTTGPTQIRHIERQRTVTLQINPRDGIALEDALNTLQTEVIDVLREQGLPPGVSIRMSGTADKMAQAFEELDVGLMMAIGIVFLVMAVLFESFVYPLIIIFAVPLAAAGGLVGLKILNLYTYQALDTLTMLGFVILIGIVVNNAILIVHQALYHLREEGMAAGDAIIEATRNRIRPIFMSTLTSVVGMLPLVMFPGAGSEIYKGLGSVVVGGLSMSAVLTLTIVPPLLALVMAVTERKTSAENLAPSPTAAE
ncbi:MAG: efflux RND transporter permease subunit [Alphaproteobacteria bacterium]